MSSLVEAICDESDRTYGYRRIHAALVRQGEDCGLELVCEVLRGLGLVPCQPRPWRPVTTQPGEGGESIPDLVGRDFTAAAPGTKLVRGYHVSADWGSIHKPHRGTGSSESDGFPSEVSSRFLHNR